jgi:hypothetical protein
MPYGEQRVLEDAAFGQGLTPTRLFSLMLPVWQVEVKATVTEGRPYELIDRFLERGIIEGGLGTVRELAGFFALDEPLVDRALRFLFAIGHVVQCDGRVHLTELGISSYRDRVCYIVEREDRRKLYFEAYSSRPLRRPYYDAGVVTVLSLEEANKARSANGYGFSMLFARDGFRREALAELTSLAERDHYNLPARIDRPESLGETLVYLPLYVVRAVDSRGRTRYLAYSQAGDVPDPDLSDLCERSTEILSVLGSEELQSRPDYQKTRMTNWLKQKDLEQHTPIRLDHGAWEVVLPATAFEPDGPVPLNKLGSFVVLNTDLMYIRCEDEEIRKRALLTRMDSYLTARFRVDADEAVTRIGRIARQLGLPQQDLEGMRRMAVDAGRTHLASRLAEVAG